MILRAPRRQGRPKRRKSGLLTTSQRPRGPRPASARDGARGGRKVVGSPPPRGALGPAEGGDHPPLRPWSPAPPPGGRSPPRALYVVGPWADAAADPSLWGHAGVPLTDFTVRAATRRLVQLSAAARLGRRYSPAVAVAPALWGTALDGTIDPGALDAAARQQQQADYIDKLRAPPGRQRAPAAGRATDAQLADMYNQPWMHPSPARAPAAERARSRDAAAGQTQTAPQCAYRLSPITRPHTLSFRPPRALSRAEAGRGPRGREEVVKRPLFFFVNMRLHGGSEVPSTYM
jgi:hypothetical protein